MISLRSSPLIACSAALLFGSCRPQLSRELIQAHPTIRIVSAESQVTESSQPVRPSWLDRTEGQARLGDAMEFVGQASAASLAVASDDAERDLLAAVSSFVSVEVESQFEAVETHGSGPSGVEEGQTVRSMVRTRSLSTIRDLKREQIYWEKVAPASFAGEEAAFRAFVYARVSREQIQRARLAAELERQKSGGRRVVVILPPLNRGAPSAIGLVLVDALHRSLDGEANLHLVDAHLVEQTIEAAAAAKEDPFTRALDTFVPDLVITPSIQLHQQRIKIDYAIHHGADRRRLAEKSFVRSERELFELEREVRAALRADLTLGARGERPATGQERDPLIVAESAAAVAEAEQLSRAGRNDAALAGLERALRATPNHFAAQLRAGRVLERMGRYGRFANTNAARANAAGPPTELALCVGFPKRLHALGLMREFQREAAPADDPNAADGDAILGAAAAESGAGSASASPALGSAVEAYGRALQLALSSGDDRAIFDAKLALADLAVRVDRLRPARAIYRQLEAQAIAAADLHREALACVGLAAVARLDNGVALALAKLERALEIRVVLRDKPYLLEVYNELGGVFFEASRYDEAMSSYEAALRLARDLDDDYLRAVLANNLGILEAIHGRPYRASELLQEAWAHLERLDQAEGRIAASLNLGWLSGRNGDLARARTYLEATRKLMGPASPLGRQAQLLDLEGNLSARARDTAALGLLLKAWALYEHLGRTRHRHRLENAIRVAEFGYATQLGRNRPETAQIIRCLKEQYWQLLGAGWGAYPGFLLQPSDHSLAYWWLDGPGPQVHRFTPPLITPTDSTYWVTELNAESLARVRGGVEFE